MRLVTPKPVTGFALRLPKAMFQEIAQLAAREHRSINMQMRTMLEEALEREGAKPDGLHTYALREKIE